MTKTLLLTGLVVASLFAAQTGAQAQDGQTSDGQTSDGRTSDGQDRLMIVNGNSGRVVYDDGRNDLFCVTRRHTVGYDADGQPVRRRSMTCR